MVSVALHVDLIHKLVKIPKTGFLETRLNFDSYSSEISSLPSDCFSVISISLAKILLLPTMLYFIYNLCSLFFFKEIQAALLVNLVSFRALPWFQR